MVNMFFSVFRQTQKHVFSLIQLERQGLLILDGKHVFQCFSSDPKTRVFECFWVSLSILDGKNVFQCFWSDPKTRVFESFSEVLRSVLFLPSRAGTLPGTEHGGASGGAAA